MLLLVIGIITFAVLYGINFSKKDVSHINLIDRYVKLMLYRKYGSFERKTWVSPFQKEQGDYETYHFKPGELDDQS